MCPCHLVCPHPGEGPEGSGSPDSSPDPDAAAEPEAVREALRDFLRELRDAQRERVRAPVPPAASLPVTSKKLLSQPIFSSQEELRVQVGSLGRRLAEVEEERDNASARVQHFQKLVAESEEGDGGVSRVYPLKMWGLG